jgi:pyruvate carboxylase
MWNPFRRRRCRATLRIILERLDTMSQQLDTLKPAVAAEATVIDSAIQLINGLATQIAALPADAAAIAQLAADVQAKSDALAAAVTANAPAG